MNDLGTHILADEASTGSVVVGTGVSAALILFFEQSLERMLPYLFVAAAVILIDLVFGIRAAKKRGDRIRISRAVRRTVGKSVEYFCWAVLASSLAVATGYTVIETVLMLLVIGVEMVSIIQNWWWVKFGRRPPRVTVDAARVIEAVVEAKTGARIGGAVTVDKESKENNEGKGDNSDGDDNK